MFDFLRIPGGALIGRDKDLFDSLKEQIDRGTNEILIKPDWGINMAIVDSMNNILASSSSSTAILLNEIFFYIRNKLKSRQPNVVNLMLLILESIVKNVDTSCGDRLYASINDATFMSTLGGVVRKYNYSAGASSINGGCASVSFASQSANREVAESAIDVVQAWGEAFLPHRDTFGSNIVKTYQDLRKEGFQFKRQYDPTRIPVVITNNNRTSRAQRPGGHTQSRTSTQYMVEGPGVGGEGMDDDMILAAALQASMMDNSNGDGAQVPNHNSLASHSQYQDREPYVNELPTQSGSTGSNYSVDSLNVLMNALKESLELYKSCVLNSKSDQEILSSDSFIREIVVTIQLKQSELVGPAMNFALADASEMVDDILALNDKAASMVTAFHQLNNHKISRDELMVMIRSEPESGTATEPAKSDDLLGLFDNSDTTAPVTHTQTPAASIDLLNADDDTSFNLMHVPQPAPAAAPVVKPPLAAIPKLAPPPGSNSNQKRPSVGSSSVLLPPPPGSGATRRPSHGSSPGLTSSPGPAANSTLHDDPFHTNNTNNTSFDDTLFSTSSNSTSNTDNNATKNPFDLI